MDPTCSYPEFALCHGTPRSEHATWLRLVLCHRFHLDFEQPASVWHTMDRLLDTPLLPTPTLCRMLVALVTGRFSVRQGNESPIDFLQRIAPHLNESDQPVFRTQWHLCGPVAWRRDFDMLPWQLEGVAESLHLYRDLLQP
jgi:hypothetical protein